MASVNTNAAAITALRTLQQTNASLDKTQNVISTGYKIGEAKDNAAYWAISTTLKSDNKSLSTVKDALGLGASTVDTAYQGLNKAKDVLDEIKSKLTAATQDGLDRNTIQDEISQLQDQLKSIATSSVFSGENWLSVDSSAVSYNSNKSVVASFSRDASGSVAIGAIGVDIKNVALFDSSTAAKAGGIINGAVSLKNATTGRDLDLGTANIDGNVNNVGLDTAATNATNGTVSTATVTGASTVSGSAAKVQSAQGTDATPTRAVHNTESAVFSSTGGTTVTGDKLKFTITTDAGAYNVVLDTGAASLNLANGLHDITNAMIRDAINNTSGLAGVATLNDSGYLVLTSNTANSNTASTIRLHNLSQTNASNSALGSATTLGGLTADSSAITGGAGAATTASVTTSTFNAFSSGGSFADGDVVTIAYKLNGVAATKDVTFSTKPADQDALAAGIASAFGAAGAISGLNVSVVGGGNDQLKFETATGAAKSFELSDITVRSSAATGSVIKNIDVVSGTNFVESKSASVTTGDVAAAYTAGKFATTDKITFGLTVDGVKLTDVSVEAGANLAALVDKLNADTTFSGKAVATVDSNSKLVIHSKTTGAASGVVVNTVSFANADGVQQTKAATGFTNVATTASASTAAFTAPVTLDDNDNIYFNIKVNDATASKLVTIDKSLIDTALKDVTGHVSGRISSASEFKTVVDAALKAASIDTVVTSVGTGADAAKLVFNTKEVGSAAKLSISEVKASAGGDQISVDKIDISSEGLAKIGATSADDIKQVLKAYIAVVNTAIDKVTDAAASLGSVASRIDMQKSFVDNLMDTIEKGVGNLIDADMSEESTKLQALQVKQQLGVQALSIANQASQSILSLFRS